ncbi:DUF4870 domain-containing protein [Ignavibacterium sp.]|uniref:DUF4870 domain-containing protein n=1 Tax=Ignavibacterium sp. TaxID=2651167 RepID=UPI00220A4595|nr:DUF4870 domain-containing protein [Ignavibacterium sp.]BDQ03251.1 MAG: hypothetical protein KatS3mg037_1826 [Ignavibacterium sp.]
MWFLYLTSIIPLPVFSIPIWLFTPKSKTQFATKNKTLINYQLNILLYFFISVLMIPLLIGTIFIVLLTIFHLRFIFSSLKGNATIRLPFSFTFVK